MSESSHTVTVRAVALAEVTTFGAVMTAIADAGGQVGAITVIDTTSSTVTRDITIHTADPASFETVRMALEAAGASIEATDDPAFVAHEGGAIGMRNRVPVRSRDDLSMAYTPGVARVCMAIHDDFDQAWQFTIKANSVLVTSDGSAVAGLGDLGAEASLPACEAKCFLLRDRAGIDAFPLPVDRERDPAKIAEVILLCSSVFAGIHLTDIDPGRLVAVKAALEERLDVPVFADEHEGVACVAVAALQNAATVAGVSLAAARVALVGTGPARDATARLLAAAGADDIASAAAPGQTTAVDFTGAIPGVAIVATGGVVTTVSANLAYPGIWRGTLDCRARTINDAMLLAAAQAIAEGADAPTPDDLVPSVLDDDLAARVSAAVRNAAEVTGAARVTAAV